MIDWTKSMKQTFEFYVVDPMSWQDSEPIDYITSCSIDRDRSHGTLGSATIDCTKFMSECYIRAYLVATQGDITRKFALGTFLVQTPSKNFNGIMHDYSLDAYTPLIELKNNQPPIGYSLFKDEPIMEKACVLIKEHMRAPVVQASNDEKLYDNFVAAIEDTWLSFNSDLIAMAKHEFALDELGRVMFQPIQDTAALQPVWIYRDDDISILYPEITEERDFYDIPNVVEVVHSTGAGYLYAKVVNDDPNSPVSTVNRGFEKLHRETSPNIQGDVDQAYVDEYATNLLKQLSSLERTIKYKHGYCPVRLDDCVLINSEKADLINVKARVIAQTIDCNTGCTVEETATYTERLWG